MGVDYRRRAALVGLVYFVGSCGSGFFTHWTNTISYVWLPSGLFLGALLVAPFRQWAGLVVAAGLGDLAYNAVWQPWPLSFMAVAHVGNSISALLGASLVRRFFVERPTLASVRELVGIVGLGGVVGLIPSALIGATLVHRVAPQGNWWQDLTTWYTGDLLGVVLLTPAVLVWQRGVEKSAEWNNRAGRVEFAVLLVGALTITSAAFYFQWLRQTETLYVAFPFTIWAAVRFGLRGTTVAILIIACVAQTFTALGFGSLGSGSLLAAQKSIEILISLGVFGLVALLPATVFSALRNAQARESLRTQTMMLMATGAKLPAILDSIVHGVEAEHPEMLCTILLVDPSGSHLLVGSAPSLPKRFNDAVHGWPIGADAYVCGAAVHSNQRVIIEDLYRDERASAIKELARSHGLRACWSQPFADSNGRALGAFAVYYKRVQQPAASDLLLVNSATQLAGIAAERKQLEEQFLRAQRMEGIGTLAGGIAHDLNNVLTPIVIGAELLREQDLDQESQRLLNNIEVSARRGANLVRQVLTFARGVEGTRERIRIGAIITEMEAIAANTFPKNIVIRSALPDKLPVITGDRTQIEQVVMNLCVNARDAMPKGGKLAITARARKVDTKRASPHPGALAGDYVEIEVTDSGSGISPDVIHRIFEPFYTTKKLGQGTGLGLSTALGIVRSHGGFLEVTSKLDEGSAFRIYLPASGTSSPAPADAAAASSIPRGSGQKVLLVDDEPLIRETSSRALTEFGYEVILAANGAEGVRCIETFGSTIDVVVTDLMMPLMDGHEFIEVLRRTAPELPVITASGFDARSKGLAVHPGRHLPKPYTSDALARMVAEVLDSERSDVRPIPVSAKA
ncbi:MAG: MASE1 domain-containing protein [Opitutus sp.]